MDLLSELIDGNVRRSADENLPMLLGSQSHEVIDDGGGGHSLACAWRPLNQRQRLFEHALHCQDLTVVQLRKACRQRVIRRTG